MSRWTRRQCVEPVFKEMHGILPTIYYDIISKTEYYCRIIYNNKEAILYEKMNDGKTSIASVSFENNHSQFGTYREAENKAVEYLRT